MEKSQEYITSYPAPFHFKWKSMFVGAMFASLTIASLMAAYVAFVQMVFGEMNSLAHYLQYLPVIYFINVFLIQQKHNTGYQEGFVGKNFAAGATISIMAALFYFIIEIILYQFIPGATISLSESLEQSASSSAVSIFASIAVEIFVFGMLTTFVAFQYLKRPQGVSKTIN